MCGRAAFLIWNATIAGVAISVVLAIAGCGVDSARRLDPVSEPPINPIRNVLSTCDRAPAPADSGTLVVIDWTGGVSRQTRGAEVSAFDFGALVMIDGGEPVERTAEQFQLDVLARVQTMLCSIDPMDVAVVIGESHDHPADTHVHVTGDAPANGGKHIGQSDYDPCNEFADDAALIYGGAIASRIEAATYAEWVNAFANSVAHEIGHTLGFFHPSEETVARLLPIPSQEVMRAVIQISDLKGEQWFLIEQNTCPGVADPSAGYQLVDLAPDLAAR